MTSSSLLRTQYNFSVTFRIGLVSPKSGRRLRHADQPVSQPVDVQLAQKVHQQSDLSRRSPVGGILRLQVTCANLETIGLIKTFGKRIPLLFLFLAPSYRNSHPGFGFIYFHLLVQKIFVASRIQTRIVRAEGEYADH